jgi:hypothetical protein
MAQITLTFIAFSTADARQRTYASAEISTIAVRSTPISTRYIVLPSSLILRLPTNYDKFILVSNRVLHVLQQSIGNLTLNPKPYTCYIQLGTILAGKTHTFLDILWEVFIIWHVKIWEHLYNIWFKMNFIFQTGFATSIRFQLPEHTIITSHYRGLQTTYKMTKLPGANVSMPSGLLVWTHKCEPLAPHSQHILQRKTRYSSLGNPHQHYQKTSYKGHMARSSSEREILARIKLAGLEFATRDLFTFLLAGSGLGKSISLTLKLRVAHIHVRQGRSHVVFQTHNPHAKHGSSSFLPVTY